MEKVLQFLHDDDGMRCREDDLSYPYRKRKNGSVRFLPGYRVTREAENNVCGIQAKGAEAEKIHWLGFRMLSNGCPMEEIPPLPELDIDEYEF